MTTVRLRRSFTLQDRCGSLHFPAGPVVEQLPGSWWAGNFALFCWHCGECQGRTQAHREDGVELGWSALGYLCDQHPPLPDGSRIPGSLWRDEVPEWVESFPLNLLEREFWLHVAAFEFIAKANALERKTDGNTDSSGKTLT